MRQSALLLPAASLLLNGAAGQECPDYLDYAKEKHEPFTNGTYHLPFQRPAPSCRTFNSSGVEEVIDRMEGVIADPDLYRLFENAYPNTLDTAIKWKGVAANNSDEELTFVITGDINAMWLRDSANQMQSYLPLLNASDSPDSIASLYRGVINLQARYLLTSPYCNSFQPPVESNIAPDVNPSASDDTVTPPYTNTSVFECKYELDSLAAFLEVSSNYYNATNDLAFFGRFQWLSAIQAVMSVATAMQTPTYSPAGQVLTSPYTFTRLTTRATETLANDGLGNPVANATGLIRSAFRPSDDSTIHQLFIPANMMFARYLFTAATITERLPSAPDGLAASMASLATSVSSGIETHGVVTDDGQDFYAFEVDGYGARTVMDDANIPSLLSAPFLGYVDASDAVYQNTRARVLSAAENPYFMQGPVINAVGGPHAGPGMAWPMASIVRILTSDDEAEIVGALREVVSSTDGLGLIHESVNSWNQSDWTRQW